MERFCSLTTKKFVVSSLVKNCLVEKEFIRREFPLDNLHIQSKKCFVVDFFLLTLFRQNEKVSLNGRDVFSQRNNKNSQCSIGKRLSLTLVRVDL